MSEEKSDFVIHRISARELTPRELEVQAVSRQATNEALQRLQKASNLKSWLTWHRSASFFFEEQGINWMWDYGGVTAEELVKEQTSEKFSEIFEKEAKIAEELRAKIEASEGKENMFRIALKRVRDSHGYYHYRALIAFPNGVHAYDAGEAITPHEHSECEMIYFQPQQACTEHACDDLFKQYRDEVFHAPYIDLGTATQRLQSNKAGVNEYLLEKTDERVTKQDALNYVLVAVLGGYSNEKYYARVSDFWNRNI